MLKASASLFAQVQQLLDENLYALLAMDIERLTKQHRSSLTCRLEVDPSNPTRVRVVTAGIKRPASFAFGGDLRAIATSVSALMMMRQLLREAWPDARFVGVVHLDPAPKLVVCIQW